MNNFIRCLNFQISSAASSVTDQLIPTDFSCEVVEVVGTVTSSDVTDPDTPINDQSFSQASLVEHHPTTSDEATCTTVPLSTHGIHQHTTSVLYVYLNTCHIFIIRTASTVMTVISSDVTERDTSQDFHTSYPNTIHSGMCVQACMSTYMITCMQ